MSCVVEAYTGPDAVRGLIRELMRLSDLEISVGVALQAEDEAAMVVIGAGAYHAALTVPEARAFAHLCLGMLEEAPQFARELTLDRLADAIATVIHGILTGTVAVELHDDA